MKVRVAILEKDEIYLYRMVSAFMTKYETELEIYSFTDATKAFDSLETSKIDVFVASELFEIDTRRIPKRCGFAYLVEDPDIETLHDEMTICKFQKADLIYRQILSIYSDHASTITGFKLDDDGSEKMVMFTSVSGGTGASSMAVAYAKQMAQKGEKVLYLNLEQYGISDLYFTGEGQYDLSDIIYALKSKKSNLTIKLESTVRQDISGVYFYAGTRMSLDLAEMSEEDLQRLLQELAVVGNYNYIVFDVGFGLQSRMLEMMKRMNYIVFVSNGTEVANTKMKRAYEAIKIIEQQRELDILGKSYLIYNKFSNKICNTIEGLEIGLLGGVPRLEQATKEQVIDHLCTLDLFKLLV